MKLNLGDITVRWIGSERFKLDAGTMFGPVPKVLWSNRYPHDEDNLAPFVATPLLVRTADHNVLIDTGLGNRLAPKLRTNFRVVYEQTVPAGLAAAGLKPADIDTVILTHLDWDHAAGIAERQGDRVVLRYPNATHVINRIEWQDANNPNARSKSTYWADNWSLLADVGEFRFVEGDEPIVPGVSVHHTGGHTRGHMIVRIDGTVQTALHLADLLPTHGHLNPLWVTAFDNFPLDSIAQKTRWLRKAKEDGHWLLFYHDAIEAAIRLDNEGTIVERLSR